MVAGPSSGDLTCLPAAGKPDLVAHEMSQVGVYRMRRADGHEAERVVGGAGRVLDQVDTSELLQIKVFVTDPSREYHSIPEDMIHTGNEVRGASSAPNDGMLISPPGTRCGGLLHARDCTGIRPKYDLGTGSGRQRSGLIRTCAKRDEVVRGALGFWLEVSLISQPIAMAGSFLLDRISAHARASEDQEALE